MENLEIYFNDLTPKAQKEYLKFNKCNNTKELNLDIAPIFVLEK